MGWLKTFLKGMATDKSSAYKEERPEDVKAPNWRDAAKASGIGIIVPGHSFHGRDLGGDINALEADIANPDTNALDRSFSVGELINYYYKRKDESPEYMQRCIDLCKMQISDLPAINAEYIRQKLQELENSREWFPEFAPSPSEFEQEKAKIIARGWDGNIHAFDQLRIIYTKCKDYDAAIDICQQAKKYYGSKPGWNTEHWDSWIQKLTKRMESQNK